MRKLVGCVFAMVALGLIVNGGCASLHSASAADALAQWRFGSKAKALGMARAVYRRFLGHNELLQADVQILTRRALETLENEPVVVGGETPLSPPIRPGDGTGDRLLRQLRADLLSEKPTVVLRAIATVRAFKLGRHAPELLWVVYRRFPYRADGGLLAAVSVARRTMAVKWAALSVLSALGG